MFIIMYIVSIYSIGLFLSLLCSHHSMVDLLSCLGRYAHIVIQGPVCSYCHTGAGMLIWSYIQLSFIALKYMLVCPHAHIPHLHFICLLSFIGRYARQLINSTHIYGPVCLTLIYWPVCTSAHQFYSHLWAGMPYSHLLASMHVCSSILLTLWAGMPYSHLLASIHVCSSILLTLWAGMPLLSFIGWYALRLIYSTHSYGRYAFISFIGWYARLLIYSTHSYGRYAFISFIGWYASLLSYSTHCYRPACPYSH